MSCTQSLLNLEMELYLIDIKIKFALLPVIWAAILSLSAITGGLAAEAEYPPHLRLSIEGVIPTIDPGLTLDEASIEVTEQLFLGLTDFDPETYEVLPELASHWDISEDGKTCRFYLRKDVTWTNGEPVTAHDMVWAVRRNIRPETNSPYAYMLYILKNSQAVNSGEIKDASAVGVSATDDFTVEFRLNHPAAYFPAMAGIWVFRPLPGKVIEKYGDQWTAPQNIQTNGSYMLSAWKKGNMMILRKNPDYYDADKVAIPEVHYYIVPESYAGLLMYENNDLDILGGRCLRLPITEIPRIRSNPVTGQEYRNEPSFCTYAYGFNVKRPPVDDILVRKALCAAIDRRMLLEAIGEGDDEPATTYTRPPIFGAVSPAEGVGIRFNPVQAKKWLAEAGYPGGEGFPDITLTYNVSETHRKFAQAVQTLLKHYLNINVITDGREWAAYVEAISQPNTPHIFRMGWCADYPDANNFLNEVLHPFNSSNRIGWENLEFAELMDKAQQNTDPKQRKAFYRRAEQILTEEECAILPIYFETAQYLVNPRLKGWYHMAMGGQHIRNWGFYEDISPRAAKTEHYAGQHASKRSKFSLEEILSRTYYGNSVWQWAATLTLIAFSILAGKIMYWISCNIFKKLTEKTETKLDDILVDMTEEPVVLAGVLAAIWYSLKLLTLSPAGELWTGRIFYILTVFDIAWLVSRTADALVEHYVVPMTEKKETDLDDMLVPMTRNLFRFVVWSLAVALAMNNAGYDVGAVIAGLGIGGLAMAMAAEDTFANIFGGISIMMSRPFKIGDRVRAAGVHGWVRNIGLRVTMISNFYGRKITVPNKMFTEGAIENVDTQPCYMQLMNLRLRYDTSPEKIQSALDILKELTLKNEYVDDTAWIGTDKIGDCSPDIEFWYAVKLWEPEDQAAFSNPYHKIILAKSRMNLEILRRFGTEGIKLALPAEIRIKKTSIKKASEVLKTSGI